LFSPSPVPKILPPNFQPHGLCKKSGNRTLILFNPQDISKTVLNPIYMIHVLFPQVPHKTKLSDAEAEYEEEYGVKHNILWPFLETQIFLFKKKILFMATQCI